jgi:hypothetical protein
LIERGSRSVSLIVMIEYCARAALRQLRIARLMFFFKLMAASGRYPHRLLAIMAVPSLLVMTSCGGVDDGLGKRYSVSGNVTYNGNPLAKGKISFVPEEATGVGASGIIENGSYKLSTGAENDGARAGKYKVTVTAKEDSVEKAKADFAKVNKGTDPNYVPGRFLGRADAEAKSLIPTGYGDPRTTNLKAEVKEGSNSIPFELSDTGAPPPPPDASAPSKGRSRN